jgi:hypothetical protein
MEGSLNCLILGGISFKNVFSLGIGKENMVGDKS